MVICSCSILTDKEIREYLLRVNPDYLPSVKKVMDELGKEVVCATCSKVIKEMIRNHYNGEENV